MTMGWSFLYQKRVRRYCLGECIKSPPSSKECVHVRNYDFHSESASVSLVVHFEISAGHPSCRAHT